MQEIKLPELGENIDSVDVAAILVGVGDVVKKDQPLIEVETEKASLEVPSTVDGRVAELLVSQGDKITVGQVLIKLETDVAAATGGEAPPPASIEGPIETPAETVVEAAPEIISFPVTQPREPGPGAMVPAAPSVRALARELGIDITGVRGGGPGGRISRDDVKAHAKALIRGGGSVASAGAEPAPLPDFGQWGEVERKPLTSVRRATAKAMSTAWHTVPHVTQFDHADITQLESMRKRFNRRPEAAERKLSMTAIVVKMVASALRQFPQFNASLDLPDDTVVFKKYVHIGVAADTERGLLVPVVRDVDRKSLVQVTVEIGELARRARDRKLGLDEMRGATFTVSNLGGLGTTYFSPIVNWPEVAILGVGRARHEAVFEDGQFQPRLVLPLSLSYDHRLIDGADAARFLRWLAEALEQPLLLLLED